VPPIQVFPAATELRWPLERSKPLLVCKKKVSYVLLKIINFFICRRWKYFEQFYQKNSRFFKHLHMRRVKWIYFYSMFWIFLHFTVNFQQVWSTVRHPRGTISRAVFYHLICLPQSQEAQRTSTQITAQGARLLETRFIPVRLEVLTAQVRLWQGWQVTLAHAPCSL
jgi:hypothetical protein